jgi:4-hydroxy-3-polyprenylbenzoate decarboxylase
LKRIVVAITGASGVVYGIQMVTELLARDFEVYLIPSNAACLVLEQELGWDFNQGIEATFRQRFPGNNLIIYDYANIAAPIASGSFLNEAMVIIPCSMSTLSAIAHGSASNLITRAADVMLKEKRPLVIVPRETPLNTIHLRNMLLLSKIGVNIVPAMPAFYNKPASLDDMIKFMVGKVLDILHIPNDLFQRYP